MKFNPDEKVERGGEAEGSAAVTAEAGGSAGPQAQAGAGGEQAQKVQPGRPGWMKALMIGVLSFVFVGVALVVGMSMSASAKQQDPAAAVPAGMGSQVAQPEAAKSGALARMEGDLEGAGEAEKSPLGDRGVGGDGGVGPDQNVPGGASPHDSALRMEAPPRSYADGNFRGGVGGEGGSGQRITGGGGQSSTDPSNSAREGGGEAQPGQEAQPGAAAAVRSGSGGRQMVSIRYAPLPVERSEPAAGAPTAASAAGADGRVVLPPYDTQLPVTLVGTFFSPGVSSTTVRMVLSSTVSGEGWELPRGTMILGRVGSVVADSRVVVTVIGFIDPARNRFVKMGGEVTDEFGVEGLPGERKNRKSLLSRAGGVALRVLPGAVGVATRGFYYPVAGAIPGAPSTDGSQQSGEYVEVRAGLQAYVMVRDVPQSVPGRDAEGQFTPEEMEIIRSLREAQGAGRGGAR